jgi:hypothetical protein
MSTEELKAKRICADCVGEEFLKGLVSKGDSGLCDYCENTGPSHTLEDMANCVAQCFEQHFRRTHDDPYGGNNGDPVIDAIANAAMIEEEPAADIQQILAEEHARYGSEYIGEPAPFEDESSYAEKAANDWYWPQSGWSEACSTLALLRSWKERSSSNTCWIG